MKEKLWTDCINILRTEISEQDFNTWIRPLDVEFSDDFLILYAPNRFIVDWVKQNFYKKIKDILLKMNPNIDIKLEVGSTKSTISNYIVINNEVKETSKSNLTKKLGREAVEKFGGQINKSFNFSSFVQGKSNEFAFAAATQVAINPGESYNPLLIYGDVGLGKTHLMHAVGNEMIRKNKDINILYFHSERFVSSMIKSLQMNMIDEFKNKCRSVDALLIDDIQFFAGKERSQEEFFHMFNSLIDDRKQIILTCDRYPKEIEGLKKRLQSRFGWGLTASIEPPELETRVAILMKKAEAVSVKLPSDVAFFMAKRIRSNVRELEGALKRVIANSDFTGSQISLEFAKNSLKDLINLQDKLVSIDNILRVVCDYYKIKVSDILSKRRTRSVSRPRQMAMTLAKELTNKSLPEIGELIGGRDHSTVIHACTNIKNLMEKNIDIREDYFNLLRLITD